MASEKGPLAVEFQVWIGGERSALLQVARNIGERFVEMGDSGLEVGNSGGLIEAAGEERSRIAKHAVHGGSLMGRSGNRARPGAKRTVRRATQSFLGAVRQSG